VARTGALSVMPLPWNSERGRDRTPVDRGDQRRGRALAHVERGDAGAGGDQLLLGGQVGVDVAAAERVDGLLGIADDREAAGRRLAPDAAGDLPLHRVGVLELVDQRPRQAGGDAGGQRGVGLERAGGEPQHVVEVDLAAAALGAIGARDDLAEHARDQGLVRRGRGLGQRRVEAVELQHPGEQRVGGLAAGQEVAQQRLIVGVDREPLAQGVEERDPQRGLVGHGLLLEGAAGGERLVGQHPLAEAVDRGDRRGVDAIEGVAQPGPGAVIERPGFVGSGGRRRAPHHLGEQAADARAQFRGGLLGVRDDDDAIDRGVGGEQQVDDLVLEEVGLAGAGGRLDDEQPGVRIAERGGARPADGGHRRPPRRPNSGW
jgi:hypothetical protein